MKVGKYIRTPYGIRKIVGIEKDECYKPRVKILVFDRYIEDVHHFGYKFYTDEKIIKKAKFSENILDLIHVGDYVNGCKIIELATNIDGKVLYLETDITEFDNVYACGHINIYEKDIRTIVTKEQFESMKYKVGGDE